jgi:hypothetical protein
MLDNTDQWRKYQSGLDYNNRLDLYSKTDLYWRFYNDDQWPGIKVNELPKFTFNICKSAINYFIASIMSQKVKLQYSAENIPDEPDEGTPEADVKQFVELMSGYAELKWEKEKMDSKLRELLLDAGNTGDMCAYVYWDPNKETGQLEKGDFITEVVDGVNVMFGNPNNPSVEAQPYILIIGREMSNKLKEEAKANGISQELIDSISPDQETYYQAGQYGKIELTSKEDTGKTLYMIEFYKKDGIVYWNKSTRYCPIRKDVSLDIKRYPVAFGNWSRIKNSYHGLAATKGIIDNQIGINQLFAMVAYWMRYMAFGKVIINADKIKTWTNKLNEAIRVEGDVTGVVQQLQAGNFNAAALNVIDMAIKYTKDFIGASDAALGQIQPDNTSAIIAVQKAAAVPLENVKANLYQFVEDLGLIWGEFIIKKYKNRKISYKENGKIMVGNLNTEQYQDILPSVNVDVGPSSQWSEITAMQTLDNLLNTEKINLLQYLKRVPNGVITDKQGLIDDIEAVDNDKQILFMLMEQFMQSLPPEEQARLQSLPPEQMEQELKNMVMQSGQQPQPNMGDVNVLPM